jgi:hypothetical protein
MATARINIPGGVSVEIDGTPDEITAVLNDVKGKQSAADVLIDRSKKSRGQIPGLIASLKSEEFFRTPQGLSSIQKKLGEVGHHYPLTTLSGAMQSESKKRKLRRFKRDGKYVYVQ